MKKLSLNIIGLALLMALSITSIIFANYNSPNKHLNDGQQNTNSAKNKNKNKNKNTNSNSNDNMNSDVNDNSSNTSGNMNSNMMMNTNGTPRP